MSLSRGFAFFDGGPLLSLAGTALGIKYQMLAGRSKKGTKETKRLTQINANGTVVHFVRHFELSERFWWKRGRIEKEERGRRGREERGVSVKEILPL